MTQTPGPDSYPIITLKRGHDRRLLRGHPWIFSNEVQMPEEDLEPGTLVRVRDGKERFQGVGYFNPHSLIALRMLRRDLGPVDEAFLGERLEDAIRLRERLYPGAEAVRLVYAESDGLPGLVVDRYGDHLAIQVTTAGMERLAPIVQRLLHERLQPVCMVARNDTHFRSMEGLEEGVEVLSGTPDEGLTVDYLGLRLAVDLMGGQKTGLFLDQRDNQSLFLPSVVSGSVLDTFCYQGTWGLLALRAGADEVVGVDTSADALEFADRHARANGLEERVRWVKQDVIEALKGLKEAGRTFQTVILDPPAFVKSKKHLKSGLRGYLDLNKRGLEVLAPGGTLITCSCSHHVQPEAFRDTVSHAASLLRRHVRVLGSGTQSRDHPPLLTAPETGYLKCLVLHAE